MSADRIACWWCDVEPDDLVEVRTFEGIVRVIPQWPPGDHAHTEHAPSADDFVDQALGIKRGFP